MAPNKMKVMVVLAVITTPITTVSAIEGEGDIVSSELKRATSNKPDSEFVGDDRKFDDFDVFFEANRVQLNAGEGLRVRLVITNRSNEIVAFSDPVDSLQILLLDAAGYPVHIPRSIPRSLICDKKLEQAPLQHHGQFDVLGVSIEGTASVEDSVKHEVHLGPGGRYTLAMQIAQIVADPKLNAERITRAPKSRGDYSEVQPALEVKAISSGVYKIRAILSLVFPSTQESKAVLQSGYVEVSLR